ncbi:MAG: O-antigen ligase [Acidimicrobiales bacterium]
MATLTPSRATPSVVRYDASPRRTVSLPPPPSRFERIFAYVGVIVFSTGVPSDWFSISSPDVPDSADSSGPLASIVFLALAALALLLLVPRIEALVRMLERNKILVLIHAWILTTTLWSVDSATTFRRAMGLNATLLFATYLALRFKRRDLVRFAAAGGAVVVWLCLIWVVALPTYGFAKTTVTGDQWSGIFTNKNSLGQMSVYAATLLLLESAQSRWHRLWTVPSIGAAVALLVGSESKTGLATAVLLAALLIVFQLFRARRTLYGAVAISMLAASVTAVLFAIAALPFIADLLDKDVTLTGRTEIWAQLLRTIWNRPIVGYGYEAFWNGWRSPAREVWLAGDWTPVHAHNAAFQYMLDQGIVGLLLILTFFIRSVIKATKLIGLQPGAAATAPIALLSFMLLSSITEDGILGRTAPWLMICAFLAGANCENGLRVKRRAPRT